MPHNSIRVLYVNDDPELGVVVTTFLNRIDDRITVETESNTGEALARLNSGNERFDCIVSGYDLGEQNGLEFLRTLRTSHPNKPFILFTANGNEGVASEAIAAGVTDYLPKEVGVHQYSTLANRITKAVEAATTERRLKEREQEYRDVLDAYPIPTVIFDEDGMVVYVNPSATEVSGADQPSQLLGKDVVEFVHPDDRDESADRVAKVLNDREPVGEREYRILDCDGKTRYARGTIVPVTFEGESAGQAVLVDITEYRQAQQELEAQHEFTQEALDAIPDAFYVLNADGSIAQVNNAVEMVTGYSEDELRSMDPTDVFVPDDKSRVVKTIARTLQSGYEVIEANIQTKSGETLLVEFRSKRIEGPDGEIIIGIGRDISDRKRREREQQQKADRLEEFAGVVSHDLRNPLNVLRGNLNLVQDDPDVPASMDDNLDAAQRALARMEEIIDNMLSLMRAGRQIGERSQVQLSSLANRAWGHVASDESKLEVVVSDSHIIVADEDRLLQLFENLFRNAIEHGGDDVTIRVVSLNDGFVVEDTGPGIPEDEREDIFTAGYSTGSGGTGMGLTIVSRIVEAHGWTIDVTEGATGGARFEISDVDVLEKESKQFPE